MNELVKSYNDNYVCELKTISEYFNKNHRFLCRDIRKLLSEAPELVNDFIKVPWINSQGKQLDTYYLTQRGFSILVMGFTGSKALTWKIKFYNAFENMKKQNEQLKEALIEVLGERELLHTPTTGSITAEQLLQHVENMKKQNEQLEKLLYQKNETYCISDIVCRFKDIAPYDAQYMLLCDGYLEHRKTGWYPSEYYDKNDSIISVRDERRGKNYPRYTVKGVRMVEQYLLEKGYELK